MASRLNLEDELQLEESRWRGTFISAAVLLLLVAASVASALGVPAASTSRTGRHSTAGAVSESTVGVRHRRPCCR